MSNNHPILTLISRQDCHLCDDMKQQLSLLQIRYHFSVEVVDIDSDQSLLQRYVGDIPVLLHENNEICRHFFDENKFDAYFKNGQFDIPLHNN